MISLITANNALKDVYLRVIANQLNTNVDVLLGKIKHTSSDVWGKNIIKNIWINGKMLTLKEELKQEVNDWKQRFTSSEKWNKSLLENSVTVSELKNKKIEKLKQAQKQFAIDELEKIKKFLIEKIAEKQSCFDSGCYNDFADGVKTICEILVWEIDKRVKTLEEL